MIGASVSAQNRRRAAEKARPDSESVPKTGRAESFVQGGPEYGRSCA